MSVQMDINQGTLILNGHRVTGFSDSADCLSFPDASEIAAFKKGATGNMVASRTGEKGGAVTIKLLPNSPSVPFFASLVKQMDNGVPVVFNGNWVNPIAGESVELTKGVLINAPRGTTYGKGEVAERVYVFEFERITESPESSLLTITGTISI